MKKVKLKINKAKNYSYNMQNKIFFETGNMQIELDPKVALNIAYALLDSYNIDYKKLEDLDYEINN